MRGRQINDEAFLAEVFASGNANRIDTIGGKGSRSERADQETLEKSER